MKFNFKMGATNTNMAPIFIVVISLLLFVQFEKSDATVNDCKFPAIFNFGDSNSDTGIRLCDGLLIIDFLAEKLGFPHLPGYSVNKTNCRNGISFAIIGSTIMPLFGNHAEMGMDVTQMNRFIEFRNQTLDLYASKGEQADRPTPEDFSKALYTIDIGHNNLIFLSSILNATMDDFTLAISNHLLKLDAFIEKLYALDARRFWIHSTGPLGCLNPGDGPKDEIGCNKRVNEICCEFNRQLKLMCHKLRDKFQDASFVYVDVYSAKYSLFKDAQELGFKERFGIGAGNINWDGTHLTEAANKMVAERIMDGSLSDPPLPLTGACLPLISPKTEL